jgi:uncharacterized protein (DUF1786 family)
MKILTVDIGTGTQDIFLYDSRLEMENGYKLILPSPTMMVRKKIKAATALSGDILLTGVIMGGGPCGAAIQEHIKAGYRVYATAQAAKTFNDDLEVISSMGIRLIGEDEVNGLHKKTTHIEMRDFDYAQIEDVFTSFGVDLNDLKAIAIAVFDHGNAPSDVSDRKFRFDYLDEMIRAKNRLSAFAYKCEDIPEIMTRMRSVTESACGLNVPLVVMDTAPAAILGATFDPAFGIHERMMVVNIGNAHTLAFRLGPNGIEGVFEHHSGSLSKDKLDNYLRSFADGTISRESVFLDNGHGSLLYSETPYPMKNADFNLMVTGPKRDKLVGSVLKPLFAVPYGDMMLAGCFGLLSATADLLPNLKEEIHRSLDRKVGHGVTPWSLD